MGTHLFYRFGGRNGSSGAFTYAAQPSTASDARVIHASLDPSETVRQAGNAVAYTMLWAQENMSEREAAPATERADQDTPVTPRAQARPQAAPAPAQSAEDDAAA